MWGDGFVVSGGFVGDHFVVGGGGCVVVAIDGDYVVMVDGSHDDLVADGGCSHGLVIVGADGFVVGFGGSGCWRWLCCFG